MENLKPFAWGEWVLVWNSNQKWEPHVRIVLSFPWRLTTVLVLCCNTNQFFVYCKRLKYLFVCPYRFYFYFFNRFPSDNVVCQSFGNSIARMCLYLGCFEPQCKTDSYCAQAKSFVFCFFLPSIYGSLPSSVFLLALHWRWGDADEWPPLFLHTAPELNFTPFTPSHTSAGWCIVASWGETWWRHILYVRVHFG